MFGNKIIKLKDLIYERFGDYKDPSLFLCAISCNWKCCKDNPKICQNMEINKNPIYEISFEYLYKTVLIHRPYYYTTFVKSLTTYKK